jgi:uncharacterized PurR-regulated membrane protein YhhQ (DUF165 family)
MRNPSHDDRWLLPTRQSDYPSRPVLTDGRMHARREFTFLFLTGIFLVAATLLPVLGITRVIDVAQMVPDAELPVPLRIPLGVLAFPLTLFAASLVCELYGRRRAGALVLVGLVLSLGVIGLLALADTIPGPTGDSTVPAAAFVTCYAVALFFNVQLYYLLRRRSRRRNMWLPKTVAAIISLVAGWAAFALVMYGHAVQIGGEPGPEAARAVASLALAGCGYMVLFALIDLLPFVLIGRALTMYLRVGVLDDEDRYLEGPSRAAPPPPPARISAPPPAVVEPPARRSPLPPAVVVETKPELVATATPPPPPPRVERPSKAFTASDVRFFTEGDELESGEVNADDSFSDLPATGRSA